MNVLICCECSGAIRREFRSRGHNAFSCDLKPSEDGSPHHIQGDCLAAIRHGVPGTGARWDLIIAHPPCPRLALSGSLRLYIGGKRANGRDMEKFAEMRHSAAFFRSFFEMARQAGARLCVENPRQHGHAKQAHGCGPPSQTIQPHWFGEDASKATCLWLRGLPLLQPTHVSQDLFAKEPVAPRMVGGLPRWDNQTDSGQNKLAPSEHRSADRARTYSGIAVAMAEQWGAN